MRCFLIIQFKNYNFRLALYVLLLNLLGVYVIRSATNQDMAYVGKQIMGIVVGFTIVLILSLIDYHRIMAFAPVIYAVCIIGLIAVLLFDKMSITQHDGWFCRESDRFSRRSL